MGIYLDIILIAVLVISIIIGYVKGFFKVVKRFRFLFAVFFAWQFKLADFMKFAVGKILRIDKNYIYDKVESTFGEKLEAYANNTSMTAEERYDEIFGKFGKLFSGAKEHFVNLAESTDNIIAETTDYFTNAIYNLIYGTVGFIILFIVFFILFTVIYHILNKFLEIGILGFVNRILGAVFGGITGFLWAWILTLIFVNFFPFIFSTTVENVARGFGVVKWFNNSFFMSGIFGVSKII